MIGAIATAFSVFIVVAVAGFITYGDSVESDVLQSYPGELVVGIGIGIGGGVVVIYITN